VVDRDVVLRKSEAIEHHTSRLRAKLPLDPAALDADESLRNDVCFDVLQAIQACIDLAVHACTHDALGVPEGPAVAFALLERHGVISPSLALRLAKASGLRNLIVHRYADIMAPRLAEAIVNGLSDLDEFAGALRTHANTSR
jgi:uncharacterized protein YutE (UPF0331/DUF86 family)